MYKQKREMKKEKHFQINDVRMFYIVGANKGSKSENTEATDRKNRKKRCS